MFAMIEAVFGWILNFLGLVLPIYKERPRIRVTAELAPWDAEETRQFYEQAGVEASAPRGPIRHFLNIKVYAVGPTVLHLNEVVMAYREPTRWKTQQIAQRLDVTVRQGEPVSTEFDDLTHLTSAKKIFLTDHDKPRRKWKLPRGVLNGIKKEFADHPPSIYRPLTGEDIQDIKRRASEIRQQERQSD
ncbi:MAG: hypothetical protein ABL994_11585 [Verrucomicrobiales bacterium]